MESIQALNRCRGNQSIQRSYRKGEQHAEPLMTSKPIQARPHKIHKIQNAQQNASTGTTIRRQAAMTTGNATPSGEDASHMQAQETPLTGRKALFCHKCPDLKTHKIAVYSQGDSDFRMENIGFAKNFMRNHNVALEFNTGAGVIPPLYDEDEQKFKKVETMVQFCEIVKDMEKQPGYPPPTGTLPALFLPFGNQLRSSGEAVGRYIPEPQPLCKAHKINISARPLTMVDSSSDVKSCSKVLLHEIGHAVGNVDVSESERIMGPCNPGSPQDAPLGCDPDRSDNTMPAKEVKKFCTGSF